MASSTTIPQTSQYGRKATEYPENYDSDFLEFSEKHLPDAKNYWTMDIDAACFIIRDKKDRFMLLEIKRNGYEVKTYQKKSMNLVSCLIRSGIEQRKGEVRWLVGDKVETHRVKFFGYNILQLSGDSFKNSSFKWNGKGVTKAQLIELLSFRAEYG